MWISFQNLSANTQAWNPVPSAIDIIWSKRSESRRCQVNRFLRMTP